MKRVVAYLRVSTEGQAVDGISLDAQRAKVAAWCELNEYHLADVHTDAGLSGKRADNRPALQDALADANSSDKPIEMRIAQGTYKPAPFSLPPPPPPFLLAVPVPICPPK